jgi:hypothetical protein
MQVTSNRPPSIAQTIRDAEKALKTAQSGSATVRVLDAAAQGADRNVDLHDQKLAKHPLVPDEHLGRVEGKLAGRLARGLGKVVAKVTGDAHDVSADELRPLLQ